MEATHTIGEVARRVGLNASTIRYYESIGLLPEPVRESGQRRYDDATIDRLRVIDVAKRAGFSLDDARLLLAVDGERRAHEQLRELAVRKLPEVDALIARAEAMRRWLTTASGCSCDTLDVCALFDQEDEDAGIARAATSGDDGAPSALGLTLHRVADHGCAPTTEAITPPP